MYVRASLEGRRTILPGAIAFRQRAGVQATPGRPRDSRIPMHVWEHREEGVSVLPFEDGRTARPVAKRTDPSGNGAFAQQPLGALDSRIRVGPSRAPKHPHTHLPGSFHRVQEGAPLALLEEAEPMMDVTRRRRSREHQRGPDKEGRADGSRRAGAQGRESYRRSGSRHLGPGHFAITAAAPARRRAAHRVR